MLNAEFPRPTDTSTMQLLRVKLRILVEEKEGRSYG